MYIVGPACVLIGDVVEVTEEMAEATTTPVNATYRAQRSRGMTNNNNNNIIIDLSDMQWLQASLPVKDGGLGLDLWPRLQFLLF